MSRIYLRLANWLRPVHFDWAYRLYLLAMHACECCDGYGCHEDWFADADWTDDCLACSGTGKA